MTRVQHLLAFGLIATVTFGNRIAWAADAPALLAQATSDAATPPVAAPEAEAYSFHGQFTNVTQFHPSFTSPYRGPNSLDPGNRGDETVDLTLFLGLRLWQGGEIYANPEVDQGFGLSNTLGVAGFPSGEAYKVGEADPYVRLQRAFFRQTIDLGGEEEPVEPDANQLGGSRTANNIVVTAGKFSVVDIFDTNQYAHDPKADFLNWSIIDAGAFDYAADSWGYTYGASIEWNQSWWTVRGGAFDLSRTPNSKRLERAFGQFSLNAEFEERHELFGEPGKLKLLVYDNRARTANYLDAVRAAAGTGNPPDVGTVRQFSSRPGIVLNLEQEIASSLGFFARASTDDGRKEAYEFTEINRSISGGVSFKGARWNRPDDTVGLAGVINGLSNPAVAYLRTGGLGILIGDGQLIHYGLEKIIETYYRAALFDGTTLSLDYQYIQNPAYNPDRGPVSVFGFRVHAEF
jgi:high affinity Mn2+ porin